MRPGSPRRARQVEQLLQQIFDSDRIIMEGQDHLDTSVALGAALVAKELVREGAERGAAEGANATASNASSHLTLRDIVPRPMGTAMNCRLPQALASPPFRRADGSWSSDAPRGAASDVNLLVMLDCTGSMGSWIEAAKAHLTSIIEELSRDVDVADFRVAFVAYVRSIKILAIGVAIYVPGSVSS